MSSLWTRVLFVPLDIRSVGFLNRGAASAYIPLHIRTYEPGFSRGRDSRRCDTQPFLFWCWCWC